MPDSDQAGMPARPLYTKIQVTEADGTLQLMHAQPCGTAGCFLLIILPFYALGTFVEFFQDQGPGAAGPGPVFIAAWILAGVGLLGGLFASFFDRDRVRLGPAGLDHEQRRMGVTVRRPRIPLAELKRVQEGAVVALKPGGSVSHFLLFEALGEPIRFAYGVSEKEQSWLVGLLNRHLDTLRPSRRPDEGEMLAGDRGPWVLRPSPTPRQPPSDSPAELRRGPGYAEFSWPGKWNLLEIGQATFINLFVNGIVGALIGGLVNDFSWSAFFFVLPFVVIGLILLASWVDAVTAPAWRRTWIFYEQEIVERYSGFGIGRSERYAVPSVSHIELSRPDERRSWQLRLLPLTREGARYALSFVRPEGEEAVQISALTEGEARWVANVLFETFPDWLAFADAVARPAAGAVRPERCAVRVQERDGMLVLSYHQPDWGTGCFLLLFLIAWSAAGVAVLANAGWFVFPFAVSWFVLVYLLLRAFVSADEIRLGLDGLDSRSRSVLTRRRHVPLGELKDVREGTMPAEAENEDEQEEYYGPRRPDRPRSAGAGKRANCIRFETLGAPVLFARGISAEEQRWLIAVLRTCLDALRPDRPAVAGDTSAGASGTWPLRPSPTPLHPPSDSAARVRLRPDGAEFFWRGRWDLRSLSGATFVFLFWNGIVGIFVLTLLAQFDLCLCVFLIPFELIGLGFGVLWFVVVTAPAWRLTWSFRENEIVRRTSGFGVGRSRRYQLRSDRVEPLLGRIELHRADGEELRSLRFVLAFNPSAQYSLHLLALVRPDGTELLRIDLLTEGEARWMADVLFKAFPHWFDIPTKGHALPEGRPDASAR